MSDEWGVKKRKREMCEAAAAPARHDLVLWFKPQGVPVVREDSEVAFSAMPAS